MRNLLKYKNRLWIKCCVLGLCCWLSAAVATTAMAASGALPEGYENVEVIEIGERFFIQQCDDVFFNPESYAGKALRLQGIYQQEQYGEEEAPTHYVIRRTPGCCGDDGMAGFRVQADADTLQWPQPDDWVEVTGLVVLEEVDGYTDVYLQIIRIEVLPERGEEFVNS